MRKFFKRKKQTSENKIEAEMKSENKTQEDACISYSYEEANKKGFFFRINGQSCKIMRYKGEEEFLVVPDYINGKPVRTIGSRAFEGQPVKKIRLPKNLRAIKEKAFANTKLEAIELPETMEEIGEEAFKCCKSLRSVAIKGENVTEKLEIGRAAFSGTPYISASRFVQLGDILLAVNNHGNFNEPVAIPKGVRVINYAVISIGNGSGIRCIEIPSTVKEIKDKAFEWARYCKTVIFEQPNYYIKMGKDVFGEIRLGYSSFSESMVRQNIISMTGQGYGWVTFEKFSLNTIHYSQYAIYIPKSKRYEAWKCIQFEYNHYHETGGEIVQYLDGAKYCEIFKNCDFLKDKLKMAEFIILSYVGGIDNREYAIQFLGEHINKAIQYAVSNNEKDTLMMYQKLELLEKVNIRHLKYLLGKYENEAADYLKEVMKEKSYWMGKTKYR